MSICYVSNDGNSNFNRFGWKRFLCNRGITWYWKSKKNGPYQVDDLKLIHKNFWYQFLWRKRIKNVFPFALALAFDTSLVVGLVLSMVFFSVLYFGFDFGFVFMIGLCLVALLWFYFYLEVSFAVNLLFFFYLIKII